MTSVLVVDDEPQIVRALRINLSARGYDVLTAYDGKTALSVAVEGKPDVVVLDLGLPDLDGVDVIAGLRGWSSMPIIVLSARTDSAAKVEALDAGADDYVTKPFGAKELLARMRAVLRRAAPEQTEPVLRFDELEIDLSRRLVKLGGEPVHLTPTDYRLLEAMATSPGKLLTHGWLLQKVWGPGYATESHYLRLFVRQLRQKLHDDPGHPRWITTEPGVGYRWLPEPT
jgi:two-component system KDP operon response regulator KdpE